MRQLLYLISGIAIGGAVGVLSSFMPVLFRLFIFIIIATVGVMFAFISVYDTRLDRLVYHYILWWISEKKQYLKEGE